MTDTAIKELKVKRRNAKAALTRQGRALHLLIDNDREASEVTAQLQKFEHLYEQLIQKHETNTEQIVSDDEFEQEEAWLEECQQSFISIQCKVKDHLQMANANQVANAPADVQAAQDKSVKKNILADTDMEEPQSEEKATVPSEEPDIEKLAQAQATEPNAADVKMPKSPLPYNQPCGFKVEKPKMPKYSGDVREYFIFRSDFKHLVHNRYSKRDSFALLRTCLHGKPLELIKGIGSDYDAAWEYLDSIYGDPRFVADTITQDVIKFKPLRDGEDARFCELVHLIRRSYNTLKEAGRPNEMNNNHMIAVIEQRMNSDDRKVWSRHLESQKQTATLEELLNWMTSEIRKPECVQLPQSAVRLRIPAQVYIMYTNETRSHRQPAANAGSAQHQIIGLTSVKSSKQQTQEIGSRW